MDLPAQILCIIPISRTRSLTAYHFLLDFSKAIASSGPISLQGHHRAGTRMSFECIYILLRPHLQVKYFPQTLLEEAFGIQIAHSLIGNEIVLAVRIARPGKVCLFKVSPSLN